VEGAEVRVDGEGFAHYAEAVVEGDVEGSPHFFRDVAEGTFAGFDLFVEEGAVGWTTSVGVEQNVAGIFHEDCAIEVCE